MLAEGLLIFSEANLKPHLDRRNSWEAIRFPRTQSCSELNGQYVNYKFGKTCIHLESSEEHLQGNGVLQSAKAKISQQEGQINLLNKKLSEEQEKIIALENYSHWENLRFMDIPEEEHKNCTDTVYDIIENRLNINTQNLS